MPHISLKASMVLVMITIACRAFTYVGHFYALLLTQEFFQNLPRKQSFLGGSASEEIHLNADEKLL